MVAVDSSTLIAFLQGEGGKDVDLLIAGLRAGAVVLPPVALTETLSEPNLKPEHAEAIRKLPMLEIHDGYWLRAAATRSLILSMKLRARLPDTLIAQSCIDHDIALIARDPDFRHFAKHCGLKLA